MVAICGMVAGSIKKYKPTDPLSPKAMNTGIPDNRKKSVTIAIPTTGEIYLRSAKSIPITIINTDRYKKVFFPKLELIL